MIRPLLSPLEGPRAHRLIAHWRLLYRISLVQFGPKHENSTLCAWENRTFVRSLVASIRLSTGLVSHFVAPVLERSLNFGFNGVEHVPNMCSFTCWHVFLSFIDHQSNIQIGPPSSVEFAQNAKNFLSEPFII